jgi:hypothetical protein
MVLSSRRKHKAFVRAFRRKFASLPSFFKFKVHTNFSDTYDSIVVPAGVTKPTLSELETVFDEEIVVEEAAEDVDTSGDFQVGTANLYVDISTTRVGIGKTDPAYTLDVVGDIYASGDLVAFSDERKKTNIEPIPNALEKVLQLRGVTFDKIDGDDRRHAGVIAQEVEKVLPEVVYTDKDGMKSVAYGNVIGLLIEAIKELAHNKE